MPGLPGRTIPLSLPRRLIGDLVHFAKKVPSVPVQRRMNVAELRSLRAAWAERPSWSMIFAKAFACVAAEMAEFRRAYISFPRARLYEHPFSIASVAVEREFRGEPGVFFAHLRSPETQSLAALEQSLRRFKTAPLESIGYFRRALRISRLPGPLRRLAWWMSLNVSGPTRAKRLGTFGVTVYSGLGAESLHPLSPLTATLNYGVIEADGAVTVRLIYDHRVMDGATVARGLARLESILHTRIADELRTGLTAAAA